MSAPFAITGMGCVFPGADDVPSYWRQLMAPDPSVQRTPPPERFDWRAFYSDDRDAPDKGYSAIAGIVEGPRFDPERFGLTPTEALDLYAIEHWYLTALAECRAGAEVRGRCGLFVATTGVCDPTVEALFRSEILDEMSARLPASGASRERLEAALRKTLPARTGPGERRDLMLAPLWKRLGEKLLGPVSRYLLVDAACASSFYSIDHGLRALAEGRVDTAFCGGVFLWGPVGQVYFSKLSGLSAVGCRPLDAGADGTVFGDGAGFVALRRLDDAIADGDTIHAVVLGIGTSSDGRGKAVYAPAARGQVLALRRAYASSGVDPRTVQVVEAHATGTPVGDATELAALTEFFAPLRAPRTVPLGSVKGIFGHLGWAAGVASVIKLALSMRHRSIPPQPGITRLCDPLQDPASPFVVHLEAAPWGDNVDGLPRRSAASGFGFGGSNAHIILEDFSLERWRPRGHAPPRRAPSIAPRATLAVVSLGAVFPEAGSADEALGAARRDAPLGVGRFDADVQGHARRSRMMPRMVRVTDRSQLLLLQAAREALSGVDALTDALRESTDVYVGYHGPLNAQVAGSKRIFRDLVAQGLRADSELAESVDLEVLLDGWRQATLAALPETTEDSFPGVMANLLAGRISNQLDLRGANQTLDAGHASFARSIDAAASALSAGTALMALAGAGAVVTQPSVAALAEGRAGEGAVVLALMTPEGARAAGVTVRALLVPTEELASNDERVDLQGARGAISLLRALARVEGDLVRVGDLSFRVTSPAVRPVTAERTAPSRRSASRVERLTRCSLARVSVTSEGDAPPPRGALHAWPEVAAPALDAGDDLVIVGDLGANRDALFDRALFDRFLADMELLRAHAATAPAGARAAVVLLRATDHPAGGLYAGLLRSMAMERPDVSVRLLATDRDVASDAVARLGAAFAIAEVDVTEVAGQLFAERLTDAEAGAAPVEVGPGDVVIAFGGARGVTFEAARALGERGARLALVGSSPAGDDAPLAPRAEWIASVRKTDPTTQVRHLNRRYEALKAASEAAANVASLRAAGVDAVYLSCDVRDPRAVAETVEAVRRRWGRVDGVLYGASTAGQLARLPALMRDGIETNLAVKVSGLVHVVRALVGATPPWLAVFSSISSLGADGMATYAGTNAFQNALVAHLRARGWRAVAFNWPAWSGAGAAARDAALLDKMAAEGRFSLISPDEGRALLRDELSRGMPSATVFLIGDPEAASLAHRFVSPWPLLDVITRPDANTLVARRTFSLARDPWLGEHRVDGDPVVPGTFELEMAAEAACALDGASSVRAFEDVRFELFVKLFGDRSTAVEVRAARRADGAIEAVITSDVCDRRGRALVKARRHFSVVVRTGSTGHSPSPTLPLDLRATRAVPDPYHLPGASVQLTERFVTLADTAVGEGFTAARTRLDARVRGAPFDGFVTPALLLDGILRSAALQPDERGALPVLAPLALARIDFFAAGNDLALTDRYGGLDVRFRIDGPIEKGPGGRYEVSAKGALVLSADDARGYVKSVVTPPMPRASKVESALKIGLRTHPWLADAARFDGGAVLPGSFQLELAASAALRTRLGARVVAVEDVRFERLLRLYADRDQSLAVVAAPRDERRVDVTLSAKHPVEGRDDLRIARMTVVLGEDFEASPAALSQGPSLPEPHVPAALYLPASRLHLGGVFAVVGGARTDGEVLAAGLAAHPSLPDEVSARHVIPPVLLDLVLQPCVRREGDWVTTCVPASIGRVRLFVEGGDRSIRDAHAPLTLRSRRAQGASALRVSQVLSGDGRVLIEVDDFETTELGWVNPVTGAFAPTRPVESAPVEALSWRRFAVTTRAPDGGADAGVDARHADLAESPGEDLLCRVTGPDDLDDVSALVDQLVRVGRVAASADRRVRVAWGGGGEAALSLARAFVASLAEESPRVARGLWGEPEDGAISLTAVDASVCAIEPGAVVMLTGGARGVTAVLARRLLARGARLVLVGRSELDEGAADRPATLGAFLAWHRAHAPGAGVTEGRAAFERFAAARETLRTVIELRASGEVEWVTADLLDATAVRRAVTRARERFGRVDALVHAAGIERSAPLDAKSREEIAAIIGTKVDGLRHLLAAFGEALPSRVLLVGSINAVLGAAGQTDYCAASAWLGAAASALQRRGVAARCLALPAVSGAGMAARRPEVLDLLRAKGHRIFTPDEAAALLMESLGDGPAYTVAGPEPLLSRRATASREAPRASVPSAIDETFDRVELSGDFARAERTLDTRRDAMLLAHLAQGAPCLPGAAEVELVLQLVRRMGAPAAVRLENVRYHHFVKVFATRPLKIRVECAREGAVVRAKILSDVVHRDGRVLSRDKVHWSGDVHIAASHPPSPAAVDPPTEPRAVTLPCYLAGAPLFYTSAMRSVTWRGVDERGVAWSRVDAGDRALIPWATELPWEVADALAITPIAPAGFVPVIDAMQRLELFAPVASGVPTAPSTFWIRASRAESHGDQLRCELVEVIDREGRVAARAHSMTFRALASATKADSPARDAEAPAPSPG